jgi:hypothetical protein
MTHEIAGCPDCPFYKYELTGTYKTISICKHPSFPSHVDFIDLVYPETTPEDKKGWRSPQTPDVCPLKTDSITILRNNK